MFYTIYQTTNKINGKIYVGKHKTSNLEDGYIGSGLLLWRAIDKYGIENFEKKILFFCESEDAMNAKEAEIVDEDFVARTDTYNIALGGSGGWYHCNGELTHNNKHNHRRVGFLQYMDKGINPWKEWWNNASDEEIKEWCLKVSKGVKKHIDEFGSWWVGKHHKESTKEKMRAYKAAFHPQAGSKNSQYGHHWWKDPNDKTKSLSIKEGDPVPEGWIRGKWQTFSEEGLKNIREGNKKNVGRFMITNGEVNRWISKDDPIPEGFWKGMRIKNKAYIRKEIQEKKKLTEEELHQIRSAASKQSNETKRKTLQEKNYPIIKEQYEFWLNHTWSEFVEKYDYKYTQVNFNNQCKKYLGKEWHPKRNFTLAKS